ncbi:family 1 glycosylhydrolase [Salibacterium halotolerans]|uniref:6-phospho-beta-glucosidase n=1 Tax=Salibacterium halotolerans TaxID=1884432 RepID=A0A1I5KYM0_9BACI|nr:family 1 glycosylhydrolase [Salibacterium halotolerans]SFO89716.1 6-phospho-beta-glucosidase [Salibacterium halotolerans]
MRIYNKINIENNENTYYMRDHLTQIEKAINDGIPVISYTSWRCIDIVSAGTGEMKKDIIHNYTTSKKLGVSQ